MKLEFTRNIDKVFAEADDDCVTVICGWTLLIGRSRAIEYVRKYNTDPNSGFSEHQGKVILTHNGAKITFSQTEGDALIALIKAAYLGAWHGDQDENTKAGRRSPLRYVPLKGHL